jgi:sulfur carrier protein ThiS
LIPNVNAATAIIFQGRYRRGGPGKRPGPEDGRPTMKVVLPEGEIRELERDRMRIRDLLTELRINPLEVLVAKNGRITPEDDEAGGNDEIRIITVKSGG